MKRSSSRTIILACIVGALVIVVLASRSGVLGSLLGEDDEMLSPQSAYLARASLAAQERSLIADAPNWREAAQQADQIWSDLHTQILSARSVELAGDRFRDIALDALVGLDIAAPSASIVPLQGKMDGSVDHIVTITLDLQFDARRHSDIYAAVDRLEHLPHLRTSISTLRIDGPGRMQLPRLATVRMRLIALASIEGVRVHTGTKGGNP